MITIENAYEELMAEGYIVSAPKRGYFVSSELPKYLFTESENSFNHTQKNTSTTSQKSAKRNISATPTIDLVNNLVLPELFPFSVWAKYSRRIFSEKKLALLSPTSAKGIPELRQAIAEHLKSFRGIYAEPSQIVVGAGTEYLYGLLIQLLGREKHYAVENPGYKKIGNIYRAHQVNCISVPIDEQGLSEEFLKKSDADVLHISPSHHFPTGRVMPAGRRYAVLNWATQSEKRYIIEDDYDSELRLEGRPIPAMYGMDTAGRVIYMNTFTKTISPSVRISYMVLPHHLSRLFDEKLGFYSSTVAALTQYSLAEFITRGDFEKHLNRLRRFYRSRRAEIFSEINKSEILKKTVITEEGAGFHFLMKLPVKNLLDQRLKDLAADCGLRLLCLSDYYEEPKKSEQGILVINYSSLSDSEIPVVIKALEKLVRMVI